MNEVKVIFLIFFMTVLSSCYNEFSFSEDSFLPADQYTEPITFDIAKLDTLKADFHRNEKNALDLVEFWRNESDQIISNSTPNILDKPSSPSGNPRAYVSRGQYWWPDPESPDGLPYIRMDGFKNPEALKYNRKDLRQLKSSMLYLSFSYHLTEEEIYAERAIELLNNWFVGEESMMPHLQFAQGVPGHYQGRSLGIIDGRDFVEILDAILLIKKSPNWTEKLEIQLSAWFRRFYNWIKNSDFGLEQSSKKNNHGSWYDLQLIAYALATNNSEICNDVLQQVTYTRIDEQINLDGQQPHEVTRTLGIFYSMYNLRALTLLADLGEKRNIDIWAYPSKKDSKLLSAIKYMLPFILEEKGWAYTQIAEYDQCAYIPILESAYEFSKDSLFIDAKIRLMNQGCGESYIPPSYQGY